jgi:integrase
MKAWIVNRPQNVNKPHCVRYEDGKRQKSFARKDEAEVFMAQQLLGIAGIEPDTFGDAVRRVIGRKRRERTREAYSYTLKHLAPLMDMPVSQVAKDRDLVADLVAHNSRGKVMLRLIREVCMREPGYDLGGTITTGEPDRRPQSFDASEAQVAELARRMGRYAFLIIVLAYCGLRAAEAIGLTAADFGADGWLTVERQRARTGKQRSAPLKNEKAGESRRVPYGHRVAGALAEHVSLFGDGPLCDVGYQAVYMRFRIARAETGLPAAFTLKSLRQWCENRLLDAGVKSAVVASYVGHTEKVQQRHYARLTRQDEARMREAS